MQDASILFPEKFLLLLAILKFISLNGKLKKIHWKILNIFSLYMYDTCVQANGIYYAHGSLLSNSAITSMHDTGVIL